MIINSFLTKWLIIKNNIDRTTIALRNDLNKEKCWILNCERKRH